MEYQKNLTIFSKVTGAKTSEVQLTAKQSDSDYFVTQIDDVNRRIPKQVCVEVSGSFTEFSVNGRVTEDGAYTPLSVINMKTLEAQNYITEAGIYILPCECYQSLQFTIAGATNATASAKLTF